MDRIIIERWNEVVKPDDVVFHLGDFGNPSRVFNLIAGEIRIMLGNYDDDPEVIKELLEDPRVTILEKQPFLIKPSFHLGLPYLYLIHEPENATNVEDFYLYGHIHQLQMVKRNGLNVGTDCHYFTPIDFDTIKFYYDVITKHYDENVFIEQLG